MRPAGTEKETRQKEGDSGHSSRMDFESWRQRKWKQSKLKGGKSRKESGLATL